MSATTRKTSWLKQNYEKLLLVVILLLLLCSAVLLVWQVKTKTDEQAAPSQEMQFVKAKLVDRAKLMQQLEVFSRTNRMNAALGVMGDVLRVSCISAKCGKPIPYEDMVCPFCGAKQPDDKKGFDLGGIPDDWKKQYGFELDDPSVANADPDGDGFSNLEEYRAGTNPLDAKSHPEVVSKLRLWGTKQRAFKLRYMSSMAPISGTNMTYGINLRSGRTLFSKLGDMAEGYKLVGHDPKAREGDVLILEKGPEQIRLVKGRDLQQFELIADLILMLDRMHYKDLDLGKNNTVTISNALYNVSYKVIDITTNAVTMRGPQPGNDSVVVQLISDAERAEVLSAAAPETAEAVLPTASAVTPRPSAIQREGPVERPTAPTAPVVPSRRLPRGRG